MFEGGVLPLMFVGDVVAIVFVEALAASLCVEMLIVAIPVAGLSAPVSLAGATSLAANTSTVLPELLVMLCSDFDFGITRRVPWGTVPWPSKHPWANTRPQGGATCSCVGDAQRVSAVSAPCFAPAPCLEGPMPHVAPSFEGPMPHVAPWAGWSSWDQSSLSAPRFLGAPEAAPCSN